MLLWLQAGVGILKNMYSNIKKIICNIFCFLNKQINRGKSYAYIKYLSLSVTTLIIYCNMLIYNYEISNLIGI